MRSTMTVTKTYHPDLPPVIINSEQQNVVPYDKPAHFVFDICVFFCGDGSTRPLFEGIYGVPGSSQRSALGREWLA